MKMASGLSERALRSATVALVKQVKHAHPSATTAALMADALGLKVKTGSLPDHKDGAYSEKDQTIIISAKVASTERRIFTCYHEITHCLIRRDPNLYSQLNELFPNNQEFDRAIEQICSLGAAEFLLPDEFVRQLIDLQGFSIRLVQQMCEERQASGPATAIQLANCAGHQCYVLVCEMGFPPSPGRAQQEAFWKSLPGAQLYILYGCWSPGTKYPIARYTIIPQDHLIHAAYKDQAYLTGEANIPFRSGNEWRVPCEAMYYRNRVYAAFHLTSQSNPLQMKLL